MLDRIADCDAAIIEELVVIGAMAVALAYALVRLPAAALYEAELVIAGTR